MSEPLLVSVSVPCGRAVFPPHLVCRTCGSLEWTTEPAGGGTVVHLTRLTRRIRGLPDDRPVPLALVRTDSGLAIVARADEAAVEGARVSLTNEGGAVVATTEPTRKEAQR